MNSTLDTIIAFLQHPHRFPWGFGAAPPDADVVRSRSLIASAFLQQSDDDVLVMLDYDCEVPNPEDFDDLAERCHETKGIVGAVVPKKSWNEGFGCRFVDGKEHELFSEEMVQFQPGQYMGAACTAYHREMFKKLIAFGIPYCAPQGLWPFFMNEVVPIKNEHEDNDLLSEDWAICEYAMRSGSTVHAYMKPLVIHHGKAAFTALDGNDTPTME